MKLSALSLAGLVVLTASAVAAAPKWETYKSKDGNYSVSLPGKPKEKTVDSGVTKAKTIFLETDDLTFSVAYGDIPNVDESSKEANFPDIWLPRLRDDAVKNTKGKLLKDDKITVDDKYPGRDLSIELPEKQGVFRLRIVLVGKRAYHIVALG